MFTRLRGLDRLRFRHDPWLRASYARAACVLGVAPYVRDVLDDVPLRRFEPVLELGIDAVAPETVRAEPRGQPACPACRTRCAHQGIARHRAGPRRVAGSAGRDADERGRGRGNRRSVGPRPCGLASPTGSPSLGVWRGPRWTRSTQVMMCSVFHPTASPRAGCSTRRCGTGCPSSRRTGAGRPGSSTGRRGSSCRSPTPTAFAIDIATALRRLEGEPALRRRLGAGARTKVAREGLWPRKADRMVDLYRDILDHRNGRTPLTKG
jgi:hypothetical protein